jgi:hypothetical protein
LIMCEAACIGLACHLCSVGVALIHGV